MRCYTVAFVVVAAICVVSAEESDLRDLGDIEEANPPKIMAKEVKQIPLSTAKKTPKTMTRAQHAPSKVDTKKDPAGYYTSLLKSEVSTMTKEFKAEIPEEKSIEASELALERSMPNAGEPNAGKAPQANAPAKQMSKPKAKHMKTKPQMPAQAQKRMHQEPTSEPKVVSTGKVVGAPHTKPTAQLQQPPSNKIPAPPSTAKNKIPAQPSTAKKKHQQRPMSRFVQKLSKDIKHIEHVTNDARKLTLSAEKPQVFLEEHAQMTPKKVLDNTADIKKKVLDKKKKIEESLKRIDAVKEKVVSQMDQLGKEKARLESMATTLKAGKAGGIGKVLGQIQHFEQLEDAKTRLFEKVPALQHLSALSSGGKCDLLSGVSGLSLNVPKTAATANNAKKALQLAELSKCVKDGVKSFQHKFQLTLQKDGSGPEKFLANIFPKPLVISVNYMDNPKVLFACAAASEGAQITNSISLISPKLCLKVFGNPSGGKSPKKLKIKVDTGLKLSIGNQQLIFDAGLLVRVPEGVKIRAEMKSMWINPFDLGCKWPCKVASVTISGAKLHASTRGAWPESMRISAMIGLGEDCPNVMDVFGNSTAKMDMSGKCMYGPISMGLAMSADKPADAYFTASLYKLPLKDLIIWGDGLDGELRSSSPKMQSMLKALGNTGFPEGLTYSFSKKQMTLPTGEMLPQGHAFTGKVNLLGVIGSIKLRVNPKPSVHADSFSADIELKPMKFASGAIVIQRSGADSQNGPHARIAVNPITKKFLVDAQGFVNIMGMTVATKLNVNEKALEFVAEGGLFGGFLKVRAQVQADLPLAETTVFKLHAYLIVGSLDKLRKAVVDKIKKHIVQALKKVKELFGEMSKVRDRVQKALKKIGVDLPLSLENLENTKSDEVHLAEQHEGLLGEESPDTSKFWDCLRTDCRKPASSSQLRKSSGMGMEDELIQLGADAEWGRRRRRRAPRRRRWCGLSCIKEKANKVLDKKNELVQKAKQKAQEIANKAKEKALEKAKKVETKAKEVAKKTDIKELKDKAVAKAKAEAARIAAKAAEKQDKITEKLAEKTKKIAAKAKAKLMKKLMRPFETARKLYEEGKAKFAGLAKIALNMKEATEGDILTFCGADFTANISLSMASSVAVGVRMIIRGQASHVKLHIDFKDKDRTLKNIKGPIWDKLKKIFTSNKKGADKCSDVLPEPAKLGVSPHLKGFPKNVPDADHIRCMASKKPKALCDKEQLFREGMKKLPKWIADKVRAQKAKLEKMIAQHTQRLKQKILENAMEKAMESGAEAKVKQIYTSLNENKEVYVKKVKGIKNKAMAEVEKVKGIKNKFRKAGNNSSLLEDNRALAEDMAYNTMQTTLA